MTAIKRKLNAEEFKAYVANYNFGTIAPSSLVLHHTYRPTKAEWRGVTSIEGLERYYTSQGWPAAPHIFVAEDGIWLFTPMNAVGIHAGEGNATWVNVGGKEVKGYTKPWMGKLKSYSIGIEVVGDYDAEKWSGETLKNAISTIKTLMAQLKLGTEDIYFHRDFPSAKKSCPGWSIEKAWLAQQLFGDVACDQSCKKHCV